MTNSQRLNLVRRCLTRWLGMHSQMSPGDKPIRESILIRDGFYCGRRFDAGAFEAVWFIEEDELKISDSTGQLAETFAGSQIDAMASTREEQQQRPAVHLPAIYDPSFAKAVADAPAQIGPVSAGDTARDWQTSSAHRRRAA